MIEDGMIEIKIVPCIILAFKSSEDIFIVRINLTHTQLALKLFCELEDDDDIHLNFFC